MASPAMLARLALITFTVFGVAWMHTFGHSPGHSAAEAHHRQPHPQSASFHDDSAAQLRSVETPADASATACHTSCPDGTGMSMFSVCLAILSSLGLLYALAIGWLARARGALTAWLAAAAWQPTGRGPPDLYLGLRLTRLTVSRT